MVTIDLPPLREHREDIAPLARHFIAALGKSEGRPRATLSDAALAALEAQSWERGNVRQLRNFLEALLVLSLQDTLDAPDVESELSRRAGRAAGAAPADGKPLPLAAAVRAAEKTAVVAALRYSKGSREVAARLLEVSRRTLQYKIAEFGL